MENTSFRVLHLEYLVKYNPPKSLPHAIYRCLIKLTKLIGGITLIYLILFILSIQVGLSNEITPIPQVELENFNNTLSLFADVLFGYSWVSFAWIFIFEIVKEYKYRKFRKENGLEEIKTKQKAI